jgi:hypothetical protein
MEGAAVKDMIDAAIRAAKELGPAVVVPTILLCLVIYLFREAAVTVHATVLVPVVESHKTFLEATTTTLKEISSTQARQAETLEELAIGQREIQHRITGGPGPVRQP